MEHSKKHSSCPVCQSESVHLALNLKDHFLTKEQFSLLECPNCHVRITSPQPNSDIIFQYYKSDDYVSHSDTNKGLINTAYQVVKRYTLGQKIRLLKRFADSPTILDYGCGTGDFLVRCQSQGLTCMGVEPDTHAQSIAQSKGIRALTPESLEQIDEKFDVVTMWHVLEHTYDPIKIIQTLKQRLNNGGILVVAVPNYLSHDASYYNEYWAAYDVPRHLFHFSPETMTLVASLTNFNLIHKQGMFFDAFYVSMLSEKYRGRNPIIGLLRGLLSNLKAVNSSNYSSMIYILRKEAV